MISETVRSLFDYDNLIFFLHINSTIAKLLAVNKSCPYKHQCQFGLTHCWFKHDNISANMLTYNPYSDAPSSRNVIHAPLNRIATSKRHSLAELVQSTQRLQLMVKTELRNRVLLPTIIRLANLHIQVTLPWVPTLDIQIVKGW